MGNNKRILKSICTSSMLVISAMAATQPALATTDNSIGNGSLSTWVEFASDYVFRGESETNDGQIPSLKGQITWTHESGFYAGYYMANALFPGGDEVTNYNNPNINAVTGITMGMSVEDIAGTGFNYSGSLFQYIYPGDSQSNYLEMFNFIDKQFGDVNLKFEYSPTLNDWFGVKDLLSWHVATHIAVDIPMEFTVSTSIGYQGFDYSGNAGYEDIESLDWTHWNIGISRPIAGYVVDLRYHDTDLDGYHAFYGTNTNSNHIFDNRIVIAISKTF
ncbi:TorF family putative porin [Pseudoalteromonas sp. S4741]|uniref:TorF family putative porin n=1 Tax=Pseudoalteromonas sp. S4741 TaxID=579563 RepID=UPI00110A98ED|nr:TorF family putative porin [Pseudoalteromonas sp. S4741]TMO28188.1 hypothetical protein CWC30_00910 [Pseudoalteromonas sp. S4741]